MSQQHACPCSLRDIRHHSADLSRPLICSCIILDLCDQLDSCKSSCQIMTANLFTHASIAAVQGPLKSHGAGGGA